MISDKELSKQILKRDMVNLYKQMPQLAYQLGINVSPLVGMFEDKIIKYIDMCADMIVNSLFGEESDSNIDEASDIAKMMISDKIDEYRRKVREAKDSIN